MRALALVVVLSVSVASCGSSPEPEHPDAAATARTVAQEFVDDYYHQFPEEAYEVGYPDTPMDRLGDRGAAAMTAWRGRGGGWGPARPPVGPPPPRGEGARG